MMHAEDIARACRLPEANVRLVWPAVLSALGEQGIRADLVEVAAAATIAVETGTFLPIQEKRASQVRQPDLWAMQERYWPSGYYGRGLIQLTWERNYRFYGDLLGLDLVGNPDLLLRPDASARVLAAFLRRSGAAAAAEAQDWRRVRRLVNGGYTGWAQFNAYVCALLEVVGA